MNNSSSNSHKRVERSTTLNRKYVKRPTPRIRTSAELHAENLRRRQALADRMNRERLLSMKKAQKSAVKTEKAIEKPVEKAKKHPIEVSVRKRLADTKAAPKKEAQLSMKEKKEQAIASALKSMKTQQPEEKRKLNKSFFTFKRVSLALCCAIFVVGTAIYFINLAMPGISVQVAAMQSGIDAIYPSYVPKGFSLENVKSEDERLALTFKSDDGKTFVLTEEKSSWNSSALESNYAKPLFQNNYSTIREQGLTLYISDSNCVWVNGGKLFTISSEDAELTKTQLTSIATSL